MRLRVLAAAPFALVIASACVGDDPGAGPVGGGGSDVDGGASDAAPPPGAKPSALAYRDADLRRGSLGGTITVGRASDESAVAAYRVYFGKDATTKLLPSPLASAPASGADPVLEVPADTPRPPEATHLLAYAVTPADAETEPVALPLVDNVVVSGKVMVAGEQYTAVSPFVAMIYEPTTRRIIFGGSSSSTLLFCDPEFAACERRDAPPAAPPGSGGPRAFALDRKNGKLVFTRYQFDPLEQYAGLTICNFDGAECAMKDVIAGTPPRSGATPALVVDPDEGQILIAASNEAAQARLGIFRCSLTGDDCTYHDAAASPATPEDRGTIPQIALDAKNDAILVVSGDQLDDQHHLYLHRCDRQGDNCQTNRVTDSPPKSANFLASVFDDASGQLLTVAMDASEGLSARRSALFRCTAGSTVCQYTDPSSGRPPNNHINPASVALYPPSNALFFVTISDETGNAARIALTRCQTDGTGCKHQWLSEPGTAYSTARLSIDPEGVIRVLAFGTAVRPVDFFTANAW